MTRIAERTSKLANRRFPGSTTRLVSPTLTSEGSHASRSRSDLTVESHYARQLCQRFRWRIRRGVGAGRRASVRLRVVVWIGSGFLRGAPAKRGGGR
eukprot:2709962-Rhodomonas_salina.3